MCAGDDRSVPPEKRDDEVAGEATTEVNTRVGGQTSEVGWERENWTAEGVILGDEFFGEKSDDAHQVWVFRTPSEGWRTGA